MAKLDIGRMLDATKVKQVDDQHNQLEEDLEFIFGIEDNVEIEKPIFGEMPSPNQSSVNADGSIAGTMILKSDGVQSTVDDAVGFEYDDGTVRKKIAYVNSQLVIYEWDAADAEWDQVASLEQPGTGRLQDCTDVEIDTMASGKLLQVNDDGDAFELVDPASVDGINSFLELDEAPGALGTAGQVLAVAAGGLALEFIDAPDGIGDPFVLALTCSQSVSGSSTADVPRWFYTDIGTFSQCYGWADVYGSTLPGLVQEATLSANSGRGNYYITLDAGAYMVQFGYHRTGGSRYGVRSWRVGAISGSSIYGPATQGILRPALVRFDSTDNTFAAPANATRDLGSALLLVPVDDTKIFIEIQQDGETTPFNDVTFGLTIYKVK